MTNQLDSDSAKQEDGEGATGTPVPPPRTADGSWLRGKDVGPRVSLAIFVALLTAGFALHVRWLLSEQKLSDAVLRASDWFRMLGDGSWPAVLLVFGPFLMLIAVVVGFLIHFGMPQVWQSARRSLQLGALLGACIAAAWFIGTTRLAGLKTMDWMFFVPMVPPALLAFQAMVTWRQRPRSVGDFRIGVSMSLRKALEESGDVARFNEVHSQLVQFFGGVTTAPLQRASTPAPVRQHTRQGAYNPTSFAAQFAVPGLLLLIVGFGAMALATNPQAFSATTPESALRGLKWGVAGAYTYVLFTFGSRSFRNDLTVGAATWAIVTLITGPILAVVIALVWDLNVEQSGWQGAVVLFFAGLAPRRVMNIVENIALQFLKSPNETVSYNLVPLTTLRGVSSELALRLREENIEDVVGLAYADPIRLVQALPYDLRQVVEWIDQAQLAVALPDQHEMLLKRGVTGAIDLAWRWLQACVDPDTGQVVIAHAKTVPEGFKFLVGESQTEGALVYETARQMFYEEQVRLLWVMYNCFSTTAADHPDPSRPTDPTLGVRSTPSVEGAAAQQPGALN
jgi:hypothetical protein